MSILMPACPHLVIQESERELVSRGLEMEAFRSRVDGLEGELRDERGMHQREVRRIEEGLLREIAAPHHMPCLSETNRKCTMLST